MSAIEGVTRAEPGYYAFSSTQIAGTGIGYNIQARIREYIGWDLVREAYPMEKGINYADYTEYSDEVRAGFDPIYICNRAYKGWHRWEWWTELPWTSPGSITTRLSEASLPKCDCPDEADGVYNDPYASDDGDCQTSDDGGGFGVVGYDEPYEGASTGGQTVDFGTGMPNGGASVCGGDAVLDHVCVDIIYNDGTTASRCGWVTTC